MERIFNIIHAEDFNLALTNLLIDLYSSNYEKYFEKLIFTEEEIEKLNKEELEKLTKVQQLSNILETGNQRQNYMFEFIRIN